MKTITISVTQAHIDKGDNLSRTNAVALALQDALPQFQFIHAHEKSIELINNGSKPICILMPPELVFYVRQSMDGNPIKPATFTIGIP